jgi:hypothetical protein
MESVRVNYFFWLRTESDGCIRYNGSGALNVMQTKKRLTTAERLSTFQKGHYFQMLGGNESTSENGDSFRIRVYLSNVQSTACSTAYGNMGSCGTI